MFLVVGGRSTSWREIQKHCAVEFGCPVPDVPAVPDNLSMRDLVEVAGWICTTSSPL